MTEQERIDKVNRLRAEGYICAQTVAMAFSDLLKTDDSAAARALAGFGGGVGAQGEVCGVVSAFAYVAGMLGDPNPKKKADTYRTVRELTEPFRLANGCITCRELKGKATPVPCDELIRQGVRIIHSRYCTDD